MINKEFKAGSRISSNVVIKGSGKIVAGTGSEIRDFTVIEMANGNLIIGDKSVIGYNSFIQCTGDVKIGKGSLLGPHTCFIASSHPINNQPLVGQPLIRGSITIGDNVWIGANCTINTGVVIGNNAIIGANSFVNQNVPANTIYAGSPAKFIRNR